MQTSTLTMNQNLKALGGAAATYEAGTVAWNDNQRGVHGGALSCWGNNITDARILAEDGHHLPFVRPPNLNEKLGVTDADKVFLLQQDGTQVTLQHVLEHMGDIAKYMGFDSVQTNAKKPEKVVVRVQSAWVPLGPEEDGRNVAPAHYSYQTLHNDDPRNLILVGTNQGLFVHSDKTGINTLHGHTVLQDGQVFKHWFRAEASERRVGEALAEPQDKLDHFVGLKGMGKRNNCFLVISIPNQQAPRTSRSADGFWGAPVYRSLAVEEEGYGFSSAANVAMDTTHSVGTEAKKAGTTIVRPPEEAIVVTILLYNVVQAQKGQEKQTTIAPMDLALAVQDMEDIYSLLQKDGYVCNLSEMPELLHTLTPQQVQTCTEKLQTDPPKLPAVQPKFTKPVPNALSMF